MKRTRFLGAAFVLAGLFVVGNALGFVVLGPTWARSSIPVPYFTNPNGTVAGWEPAVQRAAVSWNSVPNQFFRFAWAGQTGRMAEEIDGANVVSNAIDPSRYQPGVLAVTYGWGGANYTEFGTAFIQTQPWSTDDTPRTFDVQGVATHELGHALGLGHSQLRTAVMWWATGPNNLAQRRLTADDEQGEQFLYPGGGGGSRVTVSGTVREANGQGAAGVLVSATINGQTRWFQTGASGGYQFLNVPRGTLSLVPNRANTTFTPANRVIQVGQSNIAGQDFTVAAARVGVAVSGRVTNGSGAGLANVAVVARINGLTRWFITDATGNYWFLRVPQGTLTLTPSRAGTTFFPAVRVVNVGNTNVVGQNFVGR